MKNSRRLLSLFLAAVLAVSCLGVHALAATEENVKQYGEDLENGGYVAFGDSVTRGLGATEGNRSIYHDVSYRTVEGSYPLRVATAVGCHITDSAADNEGNNYWPICSPGQSLAFTMDLLGIGTGERDELYDYGRNGSNSYWFDAAMQEYYGNAAAYVQQADLITLNLGLVDVFLKPVNIALHLNDGEITADMVSDTVERINAGYAYWKENYPRLIEYIQSVNSEAAIVLVGYYNAGGDTPLSNEILLPVGMAASAAIGWMNEQLREMADRYGCLYVDITNAETVSAQNDYGFLSDEYNAQPRESVHLSEEGNAYVARRILDALPEKEEKPAELTTDIVVDLGRFKSVNYVMLNGIKLSRSDYSMDGYVLTIPNKSKLCTNLTVAVVGDNRKISVYTYQLAYHTDTGYEAYLIYGANDVVRNTKNTLTSVFTVGSKLASAVVGLLKK